ncbi:hypothetical protein I6F35_18150 [Bradyrhizobium sp. BRP22]|uniref:hypothetical protein n=1 Tax=Bradyrhizobium sp. BRP22 TaxID=2793821 RepID=UPI001CD7980F|nr:hypothetical protein [Bradyrhizobium sp. BRP22]MCA1455130.1 hypothetical protein [Bradyrhizobium sp. BRP22]
MSKQAEAVMKVANALVEQIPPLLRRKERQGRADRSIAKSSLPAIRRNFASNRAMF